MTTMVGTVDEFIDLLQKMKKDGYKYVVISEDLEGQLSAPSKRKKYFRIGFAFSDIVFINNRDLRLFLSNPTYAFVVFKDVEFIAGDFRKFEEADA